MWTVHADCLAMQSAMSEEMGKLAASIGRAGPSPLKTPAPRGSKGAAGGRSGGSSRPSPLSGLGSIHEGDDEGFLAASARRFLPAWTQPSPALNA